MCRVTCLLLFVLIAACKTPRGMFGMSSPRDAYARSLQSAGLDGSAMGRMWLDAGALSLRQPHTISLPYKEAGFFAPGTPRAAGLRFGAPRGQRIHISLAIRPDTGLRLFAELWRLRAGDEPELLKSPEAPNESFTYEVEREGESLVLRLQPELLAAVSYTLSITSTPSLGFPVKGGGPKDIGSIWGDPRDAGARRHEGIDIFGNKRTPVVAAAAGTVTRVNEGGLGGKVVWIRPESRSLSLYYAHLDSQLVRPGQRVQAGEVLGLMGNTGNARHTATHLHFGIYSMGGPVNPYYYVAGNSGAPPAISGKPEALDSLMRTEGRAQLFPGPAEANGTTLSPGTAVRPLAAAGRFYRVMLPDGRTGWLRTSDIKPAKPALRTLKTAAQTSLYYSPRATEAIVAEIPAGSAVRIQALTNGWLYAAWEGQAGWLRTQP